MLRSSSVPRWLLIAVVAAIVLAMVLSLGTRRAPGAASVTSSSRPSAPVSVIGPSSTPRGSQAPTPGSSAPVGSLAASAHATPSSPPSGSLSLDQLLATLPVASEVRTGYERDLFPEWDDADGDGCNTRYEVLIAEAIVAPAVGPGCVLTGGQWRSAYDGLVFSSPADLQIDHVVALAEAWDSGASAWSTGRRELFANDIDVPWTLIAVSGATNEAKADSDPAEWVPPNPDAVCAFVADWIAIKARWGLSVDPREAVALRSLIAGCPGQRRPLIPTPPAGPTPVPLTSGDCSPAYPTVCIPPPPPDLDCRDITFRRFTVLAPDPHHFDGDHDGIGCEGP